MIFFLLVSVVNIIGISFYIVGCRNERRINDLKSASDSTNKVVVPNQSYSKHYGDRLDIRSMKGEERRRTRRNVQKPTIVPHL